MKKLLIILAIVFFGLNGKCQSVDTIVAFTIEKPVIDLSTGATYVDSLYVVAVSLGFEFPQFGEKKRSQLIYDIYASKSLAWSGYMPIYAFLPLRFEVGYSLSGYSVATILTKINNDMMNRFSGYTTEDIVTDIR